MMQDLTLRYSITQFSYWAASTGAASFATAYLLELGIPSALVGTALAMAGLCSCLIQPLMASWVDGAKEFLLVKLLLALSACCCGCFGLQLIPGLPVLLTGFFYVMGLCCSDAMVPLLNALSVACNGAGYPVNYGAARGLGSVASAVSALAVGFVIAKLGTACMILFLIFFRVISMAVIYGYPRLQKTAARETEQNRGCSAITFFQNYRWYCLTLMGILLMGMFHSMTENYLIVIMEALGGDSGHVGCALFIASMTGAPVIFFFGHVRKRIRDTSLLKIASATFLVKAVLFYVAPSIQTVYLLQLLQATSYGFMAPTQVYYAGARVRSCDMVKGQAFITAAYALGCSAGNFTGGQLLPLGAEAILRAGIVIALAGSVVIFATVEKKDLPVFS